jgi:phosphoglycerol transferase MdoB-like AlkP superfamily enzyme
VMVLGAMEIVQMRDKENILRTIKNGFSPQATFIGGFLPSIREAAFKGESHLVIRWHRQVSWGQFRQTAAPINNVPVILVVIESMRSDVLTSGKVMPNLFALKRESLYFSNSFPPSNESDYAWPAIMSSQYPLRTARHYYYPKNIRYPRTLIYDVLKEDGFKTAIFSAQNEEWGTMRNYLDTGGLDVFFDANSTVNGKHVLHDAPLQKWIIQLAIAGKRDDAVVMDHALQWIENDGGKKFFLAINLQRSHFPYTWPGSFTPHFIPYKINFPAVFAKYPRSEVPVMKNRYNNALSYVDNQIGRLVLFLKGHQLYDQSIIIVTGDHGEAFYERGMSCHAGELDPESTHTFIMIKAPHGTLKGTRDDFVQNIDISPTICGLLKIRPYPGFQGEDILGHLSFDVRPIFMTVNTPRANQDAIILQGWKFIKDYKNGTESLFNIRHDFMQDHDLMPKFTGIAESLRDQLAAWRGVQLDYYRDEEKQKQFYPPQILSGKIG